MVVKMKGKSLLKINRDYQIKKPRLFRGIFLISGTPFEKWYPYDKYWTEELDASERILNYLFNISIF